MNQCIEWESPYSRACCYKNGTWLLHTQRRQHDVKFHQTRTYVICASSKNALIFFNLSSSASVRRERPRWASTSLKSDMALQSHQDAANRSAKRLEAYSCPFWAKTAKRAMPQTPKEARTWRIARFFFYKSYRSMIATRCDLQWYCMISYDTMIYYLYSPRQCQISELQALLSSALAMSMAWASHPQVTHPVAPNNRMGRPGPSSSCLYPRPEGTRWLASPTVKSLEDTKTLVQPAWGTSISVVWRCALSEPAGSLVHF